MMVLPDGFKSPEHMSQTWESPRSGSTFLTKGEKINAKRWFQFNHKTPDVVSAASSELLMKASIGKLDCWFDHVKASPLGRLLGRERSPDDNPAPGDENEKDGRRPEGGSGKERAVVASCAKRQRGVQLPDLGDRAAACEKEKCAGLHRGHPQLQKEALVR